MCADEKPYDRISPQSKNAILGIHARRHIIGVICEALEVQRRMLGVSFEFRVRFSRGVADRGIKTSVTLPEIFRGDRIVLDRHRS